MDPSSLECPICQLSLLVSSMSQQCNSSAITSNRMSPVCTPCGHIFHRACITEWFRLRRQYDGGSSVRCSCPSCRKTIAYHKLIRVYLPMSTTSSLHDNEDNVTTPAPRTSTVAEAVRRYNEQHFPQSTGQTDRQTASNSSRIYNQFFTIYNDLHDINPRDGGGDLDEGGGREVMRGRARLRGNDSRGRIDFNCENEDCVALHNVYQILAREFKTLQRKLDLEIEVSKMKSIIVAGLQRDVDQLRKMRKESPFARPIGIIVISFFSAWILGLVSLMIF